MKHQERTDRFTAVEDRFLDYVLHDQNGEKIGKVDALFLDENDQPEYIGVKVGFLGTRSTLIPMYLARVDEEGRRIEVSVDKAQAKEGPAFDEDEDITPEYEQRVYSHYDLQRSQTDGERDDYGEYYGDEADKRTGEVGPGMKMGDTKTGGRVLASRLTRHRRRGH
jgi:hypothetical protein